MSESGTGLRRHYNSAVIFKQFYLNCLAHASYLIGDEQTHIAAVVDPQRDIDQYLAFAEAHGLRIQHVFLTHLHADFIAGHLELRDRAGATIYLGAAAKAESACRRSRRPATRPSRCRSRCTTSIAATPNRTPC